MKRATEAFACRVIAAAATACLGLLAQSQSIVQAEYFIDTDQGVGENEPIVVPTPADSIFLDGLPIDVTGYSPGYHRLFFRAMRENGAWGTTVSKRIYIYPPATYTTSEPLLSQAEYIIDAPALPGTGTLLGLPADTLVYYNDTLLNAQLDTGIHVVHVRAQDNEGHWGFFHTDTMRIELYDYDVIVSGPPFIRNGLSYPYNVTVKNRSTVHAADKLLRFMATRPLTVDMSPPNNTIAGVDVSDVPAVAAFNDESLWTGSIWLPPIPPQSQTTIALRIAFSQLSNTPVEMNWKLEGDDGSDYALGYNEVGSATPLALSRYASSLAQTLALMEDSISGMPQHFYGELRDTMQNFIELHPEVLETPQFLGKLMKPILQHVYGAVDDSLVGMMNSWNENVLNARTYDAHPDETDTTEMGLADAFRDTDPCECKPLSCLTGLGVPLPSPECFQYNSLCKIRCYCKCSGTQGATWVRKDKRHGGYDIDIKPSSSGCSATWATFKSCDTPVLAILPGIARKPKPSSSWGEYVEVTTDTCDIVIVTRYAHLDGRGTPAGAETTDGVHVGQGATLGYACESGNATGIHLHIEFTYGGLAGRPPCLLNNTFHTGSGANDPIPCKPLRNDCIIETSSACGGVQEYPSLDRTCPSDKTQKEDCETPVPVAPVDPNVKVGLAGSGVFHALSDSVRLAYGILFANADSATGPAQLVSIIDTLDNDRLDVASVRLPYILIGDLGVDLPERPLWEPIDTVLAERSVNGVYLGLHAVVDTISGVLLVDLTALDTVSLLPVTGALEGLLPPDTNDYDGRGMAYITIDPRVEVASHTMVCNDAYIVFDGNDAIHTGEYCNLLDGKGPQSFVDPLPETTTDTSFVVSWSGSDSLGSGVATYDIYYSVGQDTLYQLWLEATDTTSAEFNGQVDSTYYFYSVAVDSVGNREEEGLHVDASTTVIDNTLVGSYTDENMNLSLYPNPTTGQVSLRGRTTVSCALKVNILNAFGQVLLTRTYPTGPGLIRVSLDVSGLAQGTYVAQVTCEDVTLVQRLIRIAE